MSNTYNSSALTKQVTEKLKLSEEENQKLYEELSQLDNGMIKDVLEKLTTKNSRKSQKYAACIKASCIRDAQYSKRWDADPLNDNEWRDAEDCSLFIGIIEAETPVRAKQLAAIRAEVDAEVIELINL